MSPKTVSSAPSASAVIPVFAATLRRPPARARSRRAAHAWVGREAQVRLAARWEAASSDYAAALLSADDDRQRLQAQRAAATALSEHINASLLEPPLVE